MSNQEKYRQFLSELEEVPVFFLPWYLEAVCDGAWEVVLVEEGGKVQAALPYFRPRPDVITMPPLTQVLGPLLRPVDQKYTSRLSREKKLMTALIEQLPAVKSFRQNFGPAITNWLPFYWAGFQQSTRYTYRFEDLSDLERLWEGMTSQLRGHIRKSEREGIRIEERDDPESLIAMVDKSYANHGRRNPNDPELMRRLYRAAREQQCGALFFSVDPQERIHAASFLVWSEWCAYNVAGGGDPDLRSSGGHNQILWELVKTAHTRSRTFDFEGSMVEGIESAFRSFGAAQTPYFCVWKDSRTRLDRWKAMLLGKLRSLSG